MITKLAKITPGFRRFSRSQFLTENLLNQLFDHFDDQIRLSRVNLSGVGIVCGFEVSKTADVITIQQGLGVTTDGDLLHLYVDLDEGGKSIKFPSIAYTHFRVYDNSKSEYSPFFYQDNNQIELFELLPGYENSETLSLSNFPREDRPDLEDMVVLIYLENYERNINKCSSLNCDGEGTDIVANYRILITSKADAAYINSYDNTISKPNYGKLYYKIPEILLPKVIVTAEDFESSIKLGKRLSLPFENLKLLNNLVEGFSAIFDVLQLPDLKQRLLTKFNDLFISTTGSDLILDDLQYRYDILKDVVDTYNEIKRLLLELSSRACNANQGDFPKHLMLGEVSKEGVCYSCRHSFYKSILHTSKSGDPCFDCNAIANDQNDTICFDIHEPEQLLYSLLIRVVKQLENYNSKHTEIKITPSFLQGSLGRKAIPFYNDVDNTLLKLWDFEKSAKGIETSNRSYHRDLLNTDDPFAICIDKDFYRIEGHRGQDYKAVLNRLKELKREHAISFNVVALGISSNFFTQEGNSEEISIPMRGGEENYTSYYVNNRPGLEHKAGVTPKGTFVIVFLEDFLIQEGRSLKNRVAKIEAAEGFEGSFNPVIADFMVPYLYCDESLPTLKLPEESICFDSDTKPIPFETTPKDGFVVALVPRGLNGGVTRNANGRSFFNPKLVSPQLINTPIRFEINNQDTDAVITIHRRPEPIITTTVTYDNPFKTEVTVTYTVSGPYSSEITEYKWDFLGDGNTVIIEPDASGNVVRNYQNPVAPNPTVISSKLDVKTDFCSNTILIDPIIFDDPIVIELDFDRNEICVNPAACDVPTHIALIVDESGSISGNEITEIKDGLRAFIDGQEGTNNVITLLNMHDSDNGRPLNIIDELPIIASTKGRFTQWIDNYRTSASGAAGNSHFWTSGIGYLINDLPNVLNSLKTNPDIVILIADGVAATDSLRFKQRVAALNSRSHLFFYALSSPTETAVGYGNDLPGYLRNQVLDRSPIRINADFSNIETADYGTFASFNQLARFLTNLKQILDNAIGCIEKINITALQPIQGSVQTAGSTVYNGIDIQGRTISINPKEFDAYGEEIAFTVDGFETNETLLVERAPEEVRVAVNEIVYNEDRTKATVTFGVSGNFLPVFPSLLWNFGDGTEEQQGSELAQKHEYTDIANLPNRTASVSVEIANPICGPVTQGVRVVFEDVEEKVSLRINPRMCLDSATEMDSALTVPFVVTPEGGKLKVVRRTNGMRIGTNQIVFTPSTFRRYDTPIAFTVNDQPVPDTLTVTKKPNVDFSMQIGPLEIGEIIEDSEGDIIGGGEGRIFASSVKFSIVNLNEFDETQYKFSWIFGDNSTSEEKNPTHRYRYRGDVAVPVELTVSDGFCETAVAQVLRIRVAT